MRTIEALAIRVHPEAVELIDQRKLPHQEEWMPCRSIEDMIYAIETLAVRGAPLIGVAAAFSLARYGMEGHSKSEVLKAGEALKASRPTAVNLMWAVDRMVRENPENVPEKYWETACAIFDEDQRMCEEMGENGAKLVSQGENLITHCNTGSLATSGIGTALAAIQKAHDQGKKIHVYVDETRPLLQGGRLTAWELEKREIPFTLICDNMAASLMKAGKVNRAFVGSDRVATNGDFANKIGTYPLAISCAYHGVPFHPVAPLSTVDFNCPTGNEIPIEQRRSEEVRGVQGFFGEVVWAPKDCKTFNPAFDVTPVELLTSLVLDKGVFTKEELQKGVLLKFSEKDLV